MNCAACGHPFESLDHLTTHQTATGHLGISEGFVHAPEISRADRRKEDRRKIERRTNAQRFQVYCGNGIRQVLPDPYLVFGEHTPEHIQDAYVTLRNEIDRFFVDMAEEVAKRDKIKASIKSLDLSEAREKHRGKENHAA